jgi:hypothetical protein
MSDKQYISLRVGSTFHAVPNTHNTPEYYWTIVSFSLYTTQRMAYFLSKSVNVLLFAERFTSAEAGIPKPLQKSHPEIQFRASVIMRYVCQQDGI